jgi:hypothetical protein
MGLFNWTRKKKPNTEPNHSTRNTPPPSPSPLKQKLLQQLLVEVRNVTHKRNARRQQWIRKIMNNKNRNYNNPNSYIYKPIENQIIDYLLDLYKDLSYENETTFFNKAHQKFQGTNAGMTPNNKEKMNTILRKLRLFSHKLQQNNTNTNNTRRTKLSRSRFSSNASNSLSNISTPSEMSSLPSLQSLRNNTESYEESKKAPYVPRRRLQGRIINPSKQSPTEE